MIGPVEPETFPILREGLAHSKTCSELKEAWDLIRDQAGSIGSRGLDELWSVYLDRLDECDGRKVQ